MYCTYPEEIFKIVMVFNDHNRKTVEGCDTYKDDRKCTKQYLKIDHYICEENPNQLPHRGRGMTCSQRVLKNATANLKYKACCKYKKLTPLSVGLDAFGISSKIRQQKCRGSYELIHPVYSNGFSVAILASAPLTG